MIKEAARGELWGCRCRGRYQRTNPQLAAQGRGSLQHRLFEETLKPEISLLLPIQESGSEKVLPLAMSQRLLNAHFLQADSLGAGRQDGMKQVTGRQLSNLQDMLPGSLPQALPPLGGRFSAVDAHPSGCPGPYLGGFSMVR